MLQDASMVRTQWIDSMRVATSCVDQANQPPAAQQAPNRRRALQPVEPTAPATPALKQLSRFPASAVLRKLPATGTTRPTSTRMTWRP